MAMSGATFAGHRWPAARAGLAALSRLPLAVTAWLEIRLDEERGRWFLWLPVLYGTGIGIYLGMLHEPPFLLCLAALILAATLRHFLRLTALRLIASTTCLMVAAGLFTGKIRALIVDAPVLARSIGAATVTGRIEAIERYHKAYRITLRLEQIEGGYQGAVPRRVRLRYHAKTQLPPIASRIRVRASLRPPPEPVMPGGFDFARHSWFEGIGATGFVLGKIEVLGAEPPAWDMRLIAMVAALRQMIAARIAAVLSGEKAGLAQALIMGERASISEETRSALANSGLAHVVSISGFHMALTAGSAFWLIRAILATFPGLALAFPIKVWAAIGALAVASFYLMISGSAVAAVRSYIMIAIMFGAILVNRPALSLRNLAISALLILAITPESLIDPGFQMSFAATAALIAVYEERMQQFSPPGSWPWPLAMPVRALIGVVVTSLAAGLAVDPIGAYHFHRISAYSVLGNMLAMPAISIVVMPMALLALIAMPFGLESWPLLAMGAGIDAMMAIASLVSSLPGAVIHIPAFEPAYLVLIVIGGLWLLLWRGSWRFLGLLPIAGGLALAPFAARPDVWVDREGQVIAVRMKDGRLSAPKTRKGEFSLKAWLEADGDRRTPRDITKGAGFQCDEQSCLALVRGQIVSHVFHPAAFADDCRRATVLIASLPVPEPCSGPEVIIDARDLWEKGAHGVMISADQTAQPGAEHTAANAVPTGDRAAGVPVSAPGASNRAAEPSSSGAPGAAAHSTPSSPASPTIRGSVHIVTVAQDRGTRPWVVARHRRELIAPAAPQAAPAGGPSKDTEDPGMLDVFSAPSQ
jgi:competence protein ComEC